MKHFCECALPYCPAVGDNHHNGSGLGFGCMSITSMPDDQALELLRQVYDAGCRHFDTAELYATPKRHNETLLGQFFRTVPRDSFSVATKYWPRTGRYDYHTVKFFFLGSLQRLGLEYIDVYYAHRALTLEGAKEFGRTAKRLKEEGLIKEVGLSEISPTWLRIVHTEICPIDAVQQEWNLITRHPAEEELLPVCKELGITVVAYSPLARNLLAITNVPEHSQQNQKMVNVLRDMSAKYHCTTAQLSLAWLFHKANELGVTVVPIPGSTKVDHALSNLKATKVIISDPDDRTTLDSLG